MDEKSIWNYLLGRTPATEEFDFLLEVFGSDESAELYEMVRDDLIEEYLRGNLSTRDRVSFENHFLENPLHRDLLKFSKMLRELLAKLVIPTLI